MIVKEEVRKYITEKGGNITFADNQFDSAILGVDTCHKRVIYSVARCYFILMAEQGMSNAEAEEYFAFKVLGAHTGVTSPIWCYDLWQQETLKQ